jgi:hypothetical protein
MRAAQLGAPRQSVAFGGKQAAREAERRFPVRVRIAVPPEGLGSRLDQIIAWLDANCGADRSISRSSSFVFGGDGISREAASSARLLHSAIDS